MLFEAPAPPDPTPKNMGPASVFPGVLLYRGDCIAVMEAMPARCVDACVTDPPYGLGFMGKSWDTFKPENVADAAATKQRKDPEQLANLKNVYGRKRSPAMSPSQIEYDRTLEGQRAFQAWTAEWAHALRRVLKPGAHVLVCGAPRSAHRMISGLEDAGFEIRDSFAWLFGQGFPKSHNLDDGLGTALKPGHEPIVLARAPFEGTVEDNVAMWDVGALNIDGCRLGDGRWPANVLLDEPAAALLDEQVAERKGKFKKIFSGEVGGGVSRFYFVAKPSQLERNFGCDDLPQLTAGEMTDREDGSKGLTPYAGAGRSGGGRNPHPTVKPVALMRYLLRLVVPAGGVVLDPFLGSGTTGMAAVVDGYTFVGIEREEKYLKAADARIRATWAEVHA
jgi:DNA modification methylase